MNESSGRRLNRRGSDCARTGPRRANAWLAAGISVLFFAHACLGCALLLVPGFPTNFEWVVWVGVCAVCVHIVLSGATTWAMFTDDVRPPSARKKGHQIKKWVTGGLLFLIVATHAVPVSMGASVPSVCAAAVLAAAAIALCVHVCTGVKSLTRDLNADSRVRTPIRVCAIALCVAVIGALLAMLMVA